MIMSNIRSLRSKMEELHTNRWVCFEYYEEGLLVLMETWLHKDIPNSLVKLGQQGGNFGEESRWRHLSVCEQLLVQELYHESDGVQPRY